MGADEVTWVRMGWEDGKKNNLGAGGGV